MLPHVIAEIRSLADAGYGFEDIIVKLRLQGFSAMSVRRIVLENPVLRGAGAVEPSARGAVADGSTRDFGKQEDHDENFLLG